MKNYNFTPKENEFLNAFIPEQNIDDLGEGARGFNEMLDQIELKENQLKGILSSLISKGVITTDRLHGNYGEVFIYLGSFTYEDNKEELFQEIIKQSGSTNE